MNPALVIIPTYNERDNVEPLVREVHAAAAHAERELRFVWDAIRVQPKYKHDDLWAPADFDVYRWIIAQEILRLQDLDLLAAEE